MMPGLKGTQPVLKPENVLHLSWQNSVLDRTDKWLKLRRIRYDKEQSLSKESGY